MQPNQPHYHRLHATPLDQLQLLPSCTVSYPTLEMSLPSSLLVAYDSDSLQPVHAVDSLQSAQEFLQRTSIGLLQNLDHLPPKRRQEDKVQIAQALWILSNGRVCNLPLTRSCLIKKDLLVMTSDTHPTQARNSQCQIWWLHLHSRAFMNLLHQPIKRMRINPACQMSSLEC